MASGGAAYKPAIFERRESFAGRDISDIGEGDCKLILVAESCPYGSTTDIDNQLSDVKVTLRYFFRIDLPPRGGEGAAAAAAAAAAASFLKLPADAGPVCSDLNCLWMLFSDANNGLPEFLTEKITAFRSAATEAALEHDLAVTRVLAEFEYVKPTTLDKFEELARERRRSAEQDEIQPVEELLGFCKGCIEEVVGDDWRGTVKLACSHVFHARCIYEKLQRKLSCPHCGSRSIFSSETSHGSASRVGLLMRKESSNGDAGGWRRKLERLISFT